MVPGLRSAAAALATAATAIVVSIGSVTAAAPPSVDLLMPNLVQSGKTTTLVAEVSQDATLGSPTGTVTFSTGYGSTLAVVEVAATSSGVSRAIYAWTPPPEMTVPLIASFTPSGAATPAATSAYSRPQITSAPVPVALRFTQNLTSGPITLDAVLGYGFDSGSVSFLVNGKGWTGSVMTVDGVASVVWDAPAGVHTIVAQYSSSAKNTAGFSVQSGQSTQVVNALP